MRIGGWRSYSRKTRRNHARVLVQASRLLKNRFREPVAMRWNYRVAFSVCTLPGKRSWALRRGLAFDSQFTSRGTRQNGSSTACQGQATASRKTKTAARWDWQVGAPSSEKLRTQFKSGWMIRYDVECGFKCSES